MVRVVNSWPNIYLILLVFCKFNEIDDEYVVFILFTLTLQGQAKKWCQTLPLTSIYSFDQFHKEIYQAIDRYDYQNDCNRIDLLRMKSSESVENFLDRFLHLCYEFPKGVINSEFINEFFQSLILLFLKYFESKPLDDVSLPTYVDHETPQA